MKRFGKGLGFDYMEAVAVLVLVAVIMGVAAIALRGLIERAREEVIRYGMAQVESMLTQAYARAFVVQEGQPTEAEVVEHLDMPPDAVTVGKLVFVLKPTTNGVVFRLKSFKGKPPGEPWEDVWHMPDL
jgi:type II secretory pathway pseudopilin PulG